MLNIYTDVLMLVKYLDWFFVEGHKTASCLYCVWLDYTVKVIEHQTLNNITVLVGAFQVFCKLCTVFKGSQ